MRDAILSPWRRHRVRPVCSVQEQSHYSISLYYYYSPIVRTFNVTSSNLYVVEATHSEHPGGSLYLFLLLLIAIILITITLISITIIIVIITIIIITIIIIIIITCCCRTK